MANLAKIMILANRYRQVKGTDEEKNFEKSVEELVTREEAENLAATSKAAKAMYDEKRQAKLNNAAHYQRKATLDAAENVCLEYLKHIDTKFIPKGLSVNDFVKGNERHVRKLAKNLFSTNDNNLQSSLYEFVLDTKYPGTVLKDVHHRFGALAQKAVSSAHEGENVSNEALNMINNEVATEMSIKFISNKLFR